MMLRAATGKAGKTPAGEERSSPLGGEHKLPIPPATDANANGGRPRDQAPLREGGRAVVSCIHRE